MRTRTAAVTAVLLLAALTGCGSDGGAKPKATLTPKPTPTVGPEEKFLAAVHASDFDSWKAKGPTDAELVAYPPQWCAELKAGRSVEYILGLQGANLYPIGSGWGTAKPDAQELVVLGVTAYCPALRSQVTDELRDSGGF
jgi:hypothetical protein